jgi:hypothetical protein
LPAMCHIHASIGMPKNRAPHTLMFSTRWTTAWNGSERKALHLFARSTLPPNNCIMRQGELIVSSAGRREAGDP